MNLCRVAVRLVCLHLGIMAIFCAGSDTATAHDAPLLLDHRSTCLSRNVSSLPWLRIACASPPPSLRHSRILLNRAFRPLLAGGGTDYVALNSHNQQTFPARPISTVTGSFDRESGVTSVVLDKSREPGIYSLQINSNFFKSPPACARSVNPSACLGWVQFVYSSRPPGYVVIWYFLLNYGPTCPTVPPGSLLSGPWRSGDNNCIDTSNAPNLLIPVTDLASVKLTGSAVVGGLDTIKISYHGAEKEVSVEDSVLGLANNWTAAQFNVIADGSGDTADFNSGSTFVVRTTVTDQYRGAPAWQRTGFTAETNNLTLVAPPVSLPVCYPHMPAIVYTESNSVGTSPYTPPRCKAHSGL